jgi:hypothetical protein
MPEQIGRSPDRLNFYAQQEWPVTGEAKDQPWLRWPDEPENDYARFQCYRDLPPPRRTLENAYLVYQGNPFAGEDRRQTKATVPPSWKGLLVKWRWNDRCARFDIWKEKSQLEAERDGTLEAWREMGERHAREAMALQQKALERLRSLSPNELSAAEVRQFLVQAATLERLARGASLQDMARVQREKEQEAAQNGVAVITYVDDWRGDNARGKRNPNSFYGNGQGYLPGFPGAPGYQGSPVPVPGAAPGADGGDAPAQAVHVPKRRKKVAKNHPGDDAGGGRGDQG